MKLDKSKEIFSINRQEATPNCKKMKEEADRESYIRLFSLLAEIVVQIKKA